MTLLLTLQFIDHFLRGSSKHKDTLLSKGMEKKLGRSTDIIHVVGRDASWSGKLCIIRRNFATKRVVVSLLEIYMIPCENSFTYILL